MPFFRIDTATLALATLLSCFARWRLVCRMAVRLNVNASFSLVCSRGVCTLLCRVGRTLCEWGSFNCFAFWPCLLCCLAMVACPLVVFWLVRKKQNLRVRSRTRERSLRTVTHQRHELITCGLELRPLPKHLHARAALEKAVNLALDFRWDLGAGLDLLGCHDTESLQVRSQTLQPPCARSPATCLAIAFGAAGHEFGLLDDEPEVLCYLLILRRNIVHTHVESSTARLPRTSLPNGHVQTVREHPHRRTATQPPSSTQRTLRSRASTILFSHTPVRMSLSSSLSSRKTASKPTTRSQRPSLRCSTGTQR